MIISSTKFNVLFFDLKELRSLLVGRCKMMEIFFNFIINYIAIHQELQLCLLKIMIKNSPILFLPYNFPCNTVQYKIFKGKKKPFMVLILLRKYFPSIFCRAVCCNFAQVMVTAAKHFFCKCYRGDTTAKVLPFNYFVLPNMPYIHLLTLG